MPDRAVRQHSLETETKIACVSVSQNAGASGVGGKIATDGRCPFCRERQREQPACSFGRRLNIRKHGARLANDHVLFGIDRTYPVHTLKRQEHRRGSIGQNLSSHKASPSAPRHHGHAHFCGQSNQETDIIHRSRRGHQTRLPVPPTARLFEIARPDRPQDIAGQPRQHRTFKVRINSFKCHAS